ncbi:MAG: ATP-binding protein [Hyphomicrobiaceae bacterium]
MTRLSETAGVRGVLREARRYIATWRFELATISNLLLLLALWQQMGWTVRLLALAAVAGLFAFGREPRLPVREPLPQADGAHLAGLSADRAWQTIVDTMTDAVLALDAAGMVIHRNPQAAEMFPKLRTGQPIAHVSRAPELLAAIDRAGSAGTGLTVEVRNRIPVERRLAVRVAALPPDPRGILPRTLIVFRDLSEADRLAQMRADFIANASHELRTPLASLRGFVETLQGPARDDAKARERFLAIMAKEAGRMTRLIDDLLSLSRAEMRVHLPPQGTVDLSDIADFVAQTLDAVATAAGIRLAVVRLPEAARVKGDREELVQVFQNLVQNAIRYGRTGGNVEIRVSDEMEGSTRRFTVSVRDDGPGIAPDHLPRLTERFYRVNAAASRDKGGTGLGLAIVKHIVNRHRGELRIASEFGKGSTFTVVLDESEASGKE